MTLSTRSKKEDMVGCRWKAEKWRNELQRKKIGQSSAGFRRVLLSVAFEGLSGKRANCAH